MLAALLIVAVFHGALLLQGSYQRTYDAWVHIFFADHYRRWWWSSWDPRWYTGFTTVSYPPGVHQSIALLSRLVGLRMGFVLVQLVAVANLTIGGYRWARLWVTDRAAGWAAILLALSPALAETVHVFGQLPTTFALGFLLQSLPFAHRWVRDSSYRSLFAGVICTAACTAGHHVTTLFGSVFFVGPVLAVACVERLRMPRLDEPAFASGRVRISTSTMGPLIARASRRAFGPLIRSVAYGGLLLAVLVVVVLPYWLWSKSDPIAQIPIPHASRDNFLVNRNAGLVFFAIPWGLALFALPYVLLRGLWSKAWPLALSVLGLALLGTGGTTPLPRFLLGGAFDILTLDRFTFWATIAVLPLLGRMVVSLIDGDLAVALRLVFGRRVTKTLRAMVSLAFVLFTLFAANLTHYRKFQPAMIDPGPVKSFMEKDEHWRWRYLLLGFGDQMAWTSAQMTAQTVDGNYHSARRLPELTSRPVERLEGAKYSGVPGIGSLQQFLSVPSRYSLKFVFSNDQFYDPLLHFTGWHQIGTLQNGVAVWEKSDVTPLSGDTPNRELPNWQRRMWGVLPMMAIIGSLLVLLWSWTGQPLPRFVRWVASAGSGLFWRSPFGQAISWSDRGLLSLAGRIPADSLTREGSLRLATINEWLRQRTSPLRLRVTALCALMICVVAIMQPGVRAATGPLDPADVVADYYDHLDFRRFSSAYSLLDPETRPPFEEFSIDQSVDGGLVASFSKLRNLQTELFARSGDSAVVEARLVYETSLRSYPVTTRLRLVRRDRHWRIVKERPDLHQPVEQFGSRKAVEYVLNAPAAQRNFADGPTARPDILDRPRLWVGDVRTLKMGAQWMVIGRVMNVDVDPADVTVSAQMRDRNGTLLATYDAAQVTLHKLLPGESTPFRIDFEGFDGNAITSVNSNTEDLDSSVKRTNDDRPERAKPQRRAGPIEFDPSIVVPLQLPDGVEPSSVSVFARAVVFGGESRRGLQVLGTRVEIDPSGDRFIVGTLRNDATVEASVPMLLVSYQDREGALRWVESHYLEESVRPQWSRPFRIPLVSKTPSEPVNVRTIGYADEAGTTPSMRLGPEALLFLPEDADFSSVNVQPTAYAREGGGI